MDLGTLSEKKLSVLALRRAVVLLKSNGIGPVEGEERRYIVRAHPQMIFDLLSDLQVKPGTQVGPGVGPLVIFGTRIIESLDGTQDENGAYRTLVVGAEGNVVTIAHH